MLKSFAGDLGAQKPLESENGPIWWWQVMCWRNCRKTGRRRSRRICGSAPSGALALVEPGTPDGFARIRSARAALIEAGAHVAAPCTHDRAMSPARMDDWCHFSQRLARSRDHMLLKDATVPFEDERYSYVVVTREKVAHGARILAPPLETKPGLTFKLCDETGLRAQFVAARDKDEYARVRKRGWGDLF